MFLDITWQDPVTGTHGFVVIDTLVRGSASGGLRMREGCTLEEVRGLAEGMTRKEAIHLVPGRRYVPLGGAKGGIDFDPRAEGATDVLERFLVAVNPIMRAYWALGEDLGVRQDDIDEILERRALGSGLAAVEKLMDDPEDSARRSLAAFDTVVDGMPQDELVGGLGVATAALTALAADGRSPEGATAVIQGFGSMGGATARFLAEAGVRVVGIADADGFVSNPEGLDVETLSSLENALTKFPGCAVVISHDRWFLDRTCTHILAWEGNFEEGKWFWFEGNFEDYEKNKVERLGPDAARPTAVHRKLTR